MHICLSVENFNNNSYRLKHTARVNRSTLFNILLDQINSFCCWRFFLNLYSISWLSISTNYCNNNMRWCQQIVSWTSDWFIRCFSGCYHRNVMAGCTWSPCIYMYTISCVSSKRLWRQLSCFRGVFFTLYRFKKSSSHPYCVLDRKYQPWVDGRMEISK